ncbi:MAG: cytochrome B [Micrococcales bacterium]|nr:MAG: cytochrome B [Micrococcales bacterium]PIE27478.1 MAG: cytochrome B [Micrococcales bacterium]
MSPVATVLTNEHASRSHTVNRPDPIAVGTIVWLASELMFFAGLFAMYFMIRAVRGDLWAVEPELLNIPFSLTNTLILVSSSITCQLGVFKAEALKPGRDGSLLNIGSWGMREWYYLTYILGAIFVSGQIYEYAALVQEGLSISANAYGSVFYLTTGFHGLHVAGGLIAFLFVIARSYSTRRYSHRDSMFAVGVSYYWHFVDVVWIGLFSVIYLIK